jgi:hypothetical protein
VPEGGQQTDLFGFSNSGRPSKLMETVDKINNKYRRGTIRLAAEGITKNPGQCVAALRVPTTRETGMSCQLLADQTL